MQPVTCFLGLPPPASPGMGLQGVRTVHHVWTGQTQPPREGSISSLRSGEWGSNRAQRVEENPWNFLCWVSPFFLTSASKIPHSSSSDQAGIWNSRGGDPFSLTRGTLVPRVGQNPQCFCLSFCSPCLAPETDAMVGSAWQSRETKAPAFQTEEKEGIPGSQKVLGRWWRGGDLRKWNH